MWPETWLCPSKTCDLTECFSLFVMHNLLHLVYAVTRNTMLHLPWQSVSHASTTSWQAAQAEFPTIPFWFFIRITSLSAINKWMIPPHLSPQRFQQFQFVSTQLLRSRWYFKACDQNWYDYSTSTDQWMLFICVCVCILCALTVKSVPLFGHPILKMSWPASLRCVGIL